MIDTMNPITITQQQARVLRETGELVVFDVMDEQPRVVKDKAVRGGLRLDFGTGLSLSVQSLHWYPSYRLGLVKDFCPFAPGERLWVAQEWQSGIEWDDTCDDEVDPLCGGCDVWYPADGKPVDGYGRVRTAKGMPQWASRATVTTASVEPVEHDGKWCWKRVLKVEVRDA